MLRLLLDENLPVQAVAALRERGFDVVHAREIGLRSAPDEMVLDRAAHEQRVCVTLDRDLHRILAGRGATRPSVILLRVADLTPVALAVLLDAVREQIGDGFRAGIAATVTSRNIRVRRLPLRGKGGSLKPGTDAGA